MRASVDRVIKVESKLISTINGCTSIREIMTELLNLPWVVSSIPASFV